MSVIDEIMQLETAAWINNRLNVLPDRAKFRASSAFRSLQWANGIYEAGMPIPACFCRFMQLKKPSLRSYLAQKYVATATLK